MTYSPILRFCTFTLFLFISGWLAAQDVNPGERAYANAKLAFRANQLDSFTLYLNEARSYFADEQEWDKVYNCYQGLLNFYRRTGKAAEALSITDSLILLSREKLQDPDDRHDGLARAYSYRGVLLNELGWYFEAIDNYRKAIDERELLREPDSLGLANNWNNLAKALKEIGDYDQALACYNRSYSLLDPTGKWDKKAIILNNLGHIHFDRLDYEKARINFEKAYRIFREDPGGTVSKSLNFPDNLLDICNNLGKTYLESGQLDSAFYFFNEGMEVEKTVKHAGRLSTNNFFLGQYYLAQADFALAEEKFKRSLDQAATFYPETHPRISAGYLELGKLYGKNGKSGVIDQFRMAAKSLTRPPFSLNKAGFPVEMDQVIARVEMLEVLDAAGQWLQKETGQLEWALELYRSADELIGLLRAAYLSEISKQYLAQQAHQMYSNAAAVAGALNDLETAYYFMERNRGILLMESLAEKEARMFARVRETTEGQDLLKREAQLLQEIAALQRLLYETHPTKSKTGRLKITQLDNTLFERNRDLAAVQAALRNDFPAYERFKKNRQQGSIQMLQQDLLGKDQVLIEYNLSADQLLALVITPYDARFFALPWTQTADRQLDLFLAEVDNRSFSAEPEKHYRNFVEAANRSYENLLAPLVGHLPEGFNEWIVVPDGKLHLVPFNALLTSLPEGEGVDYGKEHLDYLLESVTVSYAYSAAQLLFQEGRSMTSTRGFAGFAPMFDSDSGVTSSERSCNGMPLLSLAHSKREVEGIAELWGGKAFIGRDGNLETFKDQSGNYQILHLATHACASPADPLYSKIYFGPDEYLYSLDLYDLNLAADLVVLSACETGTGKVVAGEGVYSLASGFAFAGSPSIVMSLWTLSDHATAEIMLEFFTALRGDESRAAALRAAQLNYLEAQAPSRLHPSYWAGLILVGEEGPLPAASRISLQWVWLGLLAIGFCFLFWWIIRKRNQGLIPSTH